MFILRAVLREIWKHVKGVSIAFAYFYVNTVIVTAILGAAFAINGLVGVVAVAGLFVYSE